MNYKKYIAAVIALSMATGVAGCGSSSDSSSKAEDDFSATENVAVADTESIEAIPEGAEKEILYLGEGDLNPTKGSPEKSLMESIMLCLLAILLLRCSAMTRISLTQRALTIHMSFM